MVPDVLAATGMWAKRIVIQMDNAGGHGGGKGDMTKNDHSRSQRVGCVDLPEEYARWWPVMEQPEIVFVAQPPRSPDTNALDLGIWSSLQVAVEQAKTTPRAATAQRGRHHQNLRGSLESPGLQVQL